jgi:hypothetical protein
MAVDSAEVARRFARQRPGYELVSYREVALPVFRCELSAMVAELKAIAPVHEFVLRAVSGGLRRHDEIAGVLGLDEDIARAAAIQLMREDDLVLLGGADEAVEGTSGLALTAKGHRTVAELVQSRLVETEMSVYVDGRTREVVAVVGRRKIGAFRASDTKARGLPAIHAHPRRPPKLSEIHDSELNAVLGEETKGRQTTHQVVGISELRRTSRFARPGIALAYRSEETGEVQVSLLVDGAFSEAHDEAFGRSLKMSAVRIMDDDWVSFEAVAEETLSAEVVAQAAPPALVEELVDRGREAADEQRELRQAIETAQASEMAELRRQLEDASRREKDLQRKFEGLSVRHVPVHDHPEYLRRALRQSTERVLIISPWIRAGVVDSALLALFEDAASRGVRVLVGYGIPERRNDPQPNDADKEAERKLRALARQYRSMHVVKLGDTHAKVLISDSSWAIVTSFNWLSFKGSRKLDFRDERGMYVGLPDKVNELFDEYSIRFDR